MQFKHAVKGWEYMSVIENLLCTGKVQSAALPKGQKDICRSIKAGKGLVHPFHKD